MTGTPSTERISGPKVKTGYFDSVVCDARALPGNDRESEQVACPGAPSLTGRTNPTPCRPDRMWFFAGKRTAATTASPLPMALPEELLTWISSYDQMPKRFRHRPFWAAATTVQDGNWSKDWLPGSTTPCSRQRPYPVWKARCHKDVSAGTPITGLCSSAAWC